MRFDLLTIFPHIFDSYLQESMIKRALKKRLIDVRVHDLRRWGLGPHKKVDDRPYGGGPGMVLKIEPIIKALNSILKVRQHKSLRASHQASEVSLREISCSETIPGALEIATATAWPRNDTKIILLSPAGKQFTAKIASSWVKKYKQIVFICGRYEGVDARLPQILKAKSYNLEAISIGPYVLSGGELPALTVLEAVARHIPGFLGKEESLEEHRLGVGVPIYTRPARIATRRVTGGSVKIYTVPKVLQTGDHRKIQAWRKGHKCKPLT